MREVWANALSNAYAGFNFMLLFYALLASAALLVIMRVTGLLRRDARWRRLLVCMYYLYIPVVFVICGAAWSSVSAVENSVLGAIKDARPAISSTSAEYAASAWKTVAATFKKDPSISIKDMCLAIADDYANELMEGFVPARVSMFVQPVVDSMKDGVARFIAQTAEEMVLKKVSEAADLDRNLLRSFWAADFTAVFQGGLVSDIITQRAEKAMQSLYFKVKLIFVLLMLPVLLETGFALYCRRKTAA
ncbi:MAG: hypothetical protein LBM00_06855 [Deltaproteobacteria bacterium]|jgi:hypothetical protein|nr:hypothetical protein [Deltaproteobacteria bacterium]